MDRFPVVCDHRLLSLQPSRAAPNLALPFFNTEILAIVMPTLSASSHFSFRQHDLDVNDDCHVRLDSHVLLSDFLSTAFCKIR
jgi:hypothetical protein